MTTARTICAALLLLAAWLLPQRVEACSCVQPPPPKAALARAAAVFEGKVVGVTTEPDLHRLTARLEVLRAWKGVDTRHVEVSTIDVGSMCGFGFTVGATYLVYADGGPGALSTGLCTRSRASTDAADDLAALGPGEPPPAAAPAPAPAQPGPAPQPVAQPSPPTPADPPAHAAPAGTPSPSPRAGGCSLAGDPGVAALLVLVAARRRRSRRR